MYYVFNKEKRNVFYVERGLNKKEYLKFSTKEDANNLITTLYNRDEYIPIEENQIMKAYLFSEFRNGSINIREILYCELFGFPDTNGPAFKTPDEAFKYGRQKELKFYQERLQEVQKNIDTLIRLEYNVEKAIA